MSHPFPDLVAAIRAVQGESRLDVVKLVLDDWRLTQIIALAPDAHPLARVIAALSNRLPDLLDATTVADSAIRDAIAHFIGTSKGRDMLWTLAQAASAGWGAMHADALINAAQQNMCGAGDAAALIGPSNESAALLDNAYDAMLAIRRWGTTTPDNPIAWVYAISDGERDRLISNVRHDRYAAARCLPWLPPDIGRQMPFDDVSLDLALSTFAEASPTARAAHAVLLQRLIARASPRHLGALTRLACVMKSEFVWSRVQTLIQTSPDDAGLVVAAAPWDDLDTTVRTAILGLADQSDICAAVAAAQRRTEVSRITRDSAAAFFAALHPRIWESLDADAQRRWQDALRDVDAHLAVRSLGLRPEILAKALIYDHLVTAARRHTPNAAALRRALFPIALRLVDPIERHALIAALLAPPPDPEAFFVIASGHTNPSAAIHAQDALHTPADLACAVFMQRCTVPDLSIRTYCATLRDMVRGRSWDDLAPIMALLSDAARAALIPDRDALVERLAHPDQKEALRHALDRLASLPPEVAVPTCVALNRRNAFEASDAADSIADALHAHGDIFLDIVDTIADNNLPPELLPLPEDAAQANALRALARDDPPTAQRIARALRIRNWHTATDIALSLPVKHRDALTPSVDALVDRLAHPDQQDAFREALDRMTSLSLDGAILMRFALNHLETHRSDAYGARIAAEDVVCALQGFGDVFLAITNTLADDNLRAALLPLPENAALADALRNLARDDPSSAHRLAHALRDEDRRAALSTLLDIPPHHADAVWQAFVETERYAIASEVPSVTPTIDALAERVPIVALALAMVQSDDNDVREAGFAALATRSDALRAIWLMLPREMQQFLRSHPALSDLTETTNRPSVQGFRR